MHENPRPTRKARQQAARDEQTAGLLKLGDPEGLRRLLFDHGGQVAFVLKAEFRAGLDMHEVEDALSRATMRMWQAFDRYAPHRGSLGAWLCVLARTYARNALEQKQRRPRLELFGDLDFLPDRAARDDAVAERLDRQLAEAGQLLGDVRSCIDSLPPQQRAVLQADFAFGGVAPTEELVQSLQTSRNSIYVSRNHGRKALRQALVKIGYVMGEWPTAAPDGPQ